MEFCCASTFWGRLPREWVVKYALFKYVINLTLLQLWFFRLTSLMYDLGTA